MAPTRNKLIPLAAGSAVLLGIVFVLYIRKRRKEKDECEEEVEEAQSTEEENQSQNAVLVDEESEDEQSVLLSIEPGSPMPDREGLTISSSWAILNSNSENNSPHLSPVPSDSGLDVENPDSILDDDTASATVLEVSVSERTLLEEKRQLRYEEKESVTVEQLNLHYEELLKEHVASGPRSFTSEEITEALMATQNPAKGLTDRNAEVLVGLLSYDDIKLKHATVQGIANSATFTMNQNALREKGCLPRLAKLLELQRMSMWLRHSNAATSVSTTLTAVTNLSVNEQNNADMEACVPTLIDISLDKETGEAVCLSSLQALTNLSVTPSHHGQYTRLVLRLYEFLQSGNRPIRLQALKILVNLSCNPDMVPHLLAAKAPDRLLDFLQPSATDETIILRFVTFLANILQTVKSKNIQSSSLPPDDKAASPETMYTALLGISNLGNLKNKIFLLCKHENTDIRTQAARVYSHLK